MRLIKLSSNRESFRPIEFNPVGLSLIIGKKTSDDPNNTSNGVGKTLLLQLIHFCLGGRLDSRLLEILSEWTFTLTFEVSGSVHKLTRSMNSANQVEFDGVHLSTEEYTDMMFKLCFPNAPEGEFLSFRALMNRFMRERRDAYVKFDTAFAQEKEISKLICTGFLQHLDLSLIWKKYHLKKDYDKLRQEQTALKASQKYAWIPKRKKDFSLLLQTVDQKIEEGKAKLESLEIHQDFKNIEERALALQRRLREVRNELFLLHNKILNVEKSLSARVELQLERVRALYEEVEVSFPEKLDKHLEAVLSFHDKLIRQRQERLEAQRTTMQSQIGLLMSEEGDLIPEYNTLQRYLKAQGVMREYLAVDAEIADLATKANLLREYGEESTRLESEIAQLNKEFIEEDAKAEQYLRDEHGWISECVSIYRSFTRQLYAEAVSAITIDNNSGKNQLRFDINVHLQSDNSDGINEAKIFCYDLMIMAINRKYDMHFLFHDSRLFSEIDPRQVHQMFQMAADLCAANGLQYIATLNHNMLEDVAGLCADDAMRRSLYEQSVVLELADDSVESKLLGFQFDYVPID